MFEVYRYASNDLGAAITDEDGYYMPLFGGFVGVGSFDEIEARRLCEDELVSAGIAEEEEPFPSD